MLRFVPFLIFLVLIARVGHAQSVTVGSQAWDTKNLDVVTFRNGDSIREAKSDEEWAASGEKGEPVWCYYENDPANGAKYGKLYNWYAVSDPRGLCPAGRHVPGDAEWKALVGQLGEEDAAGKKMKSTTGWRDFIKKSTGGSNESGFSGLPGGDRYIDGAFYRIGVGGHWWSASEVSSGKALYCLLYYNTAQVKFNSDSKRRGLSVRCLRD